MTKIGEEAEFGMIFAILGPKKHQKGKNQLWRQIGKKSRKSDKKRLFGILSVIRQNIVIIYFFKVLAVSTSIEVSFAPYAIFLTLAVIAKHNKIRVGKDKNTIFSVVSKMLISPNAGTCLDSNFLWGIPEGSFMTC